METRDGAAGDGDKKQRENARGSVRNVLAHGRGGKLRTGDKEGTVQDDKTDEKLQAIDVIAWLEQHPHRQQRSDEGVDK